VHATKEDIPKNAVNIDATVPLARVVDEILSKCREADRGPDKAASADYSQ
jgi:hypothetical protein